MSATLSPDLDIWVYSDTRCSTGPHFKSLIYDEPWMAEAGSFWLTRDLTENEQLDLSTAECGQYLISAVGGIYWVKVDNAAGKAPASGHRCYVISNGPTGCIRLWHS